MKTALIWGYVIGDFGDFYYNYLKNEIETYKISSRTDAFAMFLQHIKYVLTDMGNKKIKWLPEIFPGEWQKKVIGYDVVICDDCMGFEHLEIVRKNNSNARLIYWIWNTKTHMGKLEFARKLGYECWSFDRNECKLNNLKFNDQFYPDVNYNGKYDIKYDFIFVGYDKSRLDKLMAINHFFKSNGYNAYLHIKRDYGKKYTRDIDVKLKYNNLSYRKSIELIKQSRCIIDITKENQTGLTIRALEAMAYGKKLITTNKTIAERDFYDPNNILILDFDKLDEINAFMSRPYIKTERSIREKYTITRWLKDFEM